jgi:predicted dehydrogenase
VRTVIADHTQKLPADPAHRLNDPKLAGGALLDLGIYPISFAWDVFGAPETISARADFTATGVDRQTSVVFGYANGQQALLQAALDTAGPTTASVIGTDGWIDIETAWYRPTTFVRRDSSGEIVERFDGGVDGNGMWFQALELERLVGAGASAGDILPPRQSVAIMRSVDEVRAQIGLDYPLDIMGS